MQGLKNCYRLRTKDTIERNYAGKHQGRCFLHQEQGRDELPAEDLWLLLKDRRMALYVLYLLPARLTGKRGVALRYPQ